MATSRAEDGVMGAVDLAHPARRDAASDVIAAGDGGLNCGRRHTRLSGKSGTAPSIAF